MGKKLKKTEEHYSCSITYSKGEDGFDEDFDCFDIIKNAEVNDHYWVKYTEMWRSKAKLVRYLENLLSIIKEEL